METTRLNPKTLLELVRFNDQGLVPAVIQDAASKRVLTLCYLNREAIVRSFQEGNVYVFRRSQNRLMLKGETSGHVQVIKQVEIDCEGKSLLITVKQHVAVCHQGYFSCYFRKVDKDGHLTISERRVFNPEKVYNTNH